MLPFANGHEKMPKPDCANTARLSPLGNGLACNFDEADPAVLRPLAPEHMNVEVEHYKIQKYLNSNSHEIFA